MKDEIKEILEQYLNSIISYSFQEKDKRYILDYISYLQEENEELKSQLKGTTHCYDKEEHRRLEQCYCNRTDCSARIKDSKKYDSLQQRIDKVREYVKDNTKYYDAKYSKIYGELCSMPGANDTRLHVIVGDEELLKILSGDSNE